MSSSKGAAWGAAVLGALAVLAIPAGAVAAQLLRSLTLLRSLYFAVPIGFVLATVAALAARRARFAAARTVFEERRGPVRSARLLAWLGLYLAITGGLSVAVYWVLRARR